MEKKNIKCYNSGKIGGLSYLQAYKNFENADQEISAMGFTPVNPIILGLKPSRPYWMHMVWDILLLSRCGHIYLQQNWKSSRGARIEFRVAKFLGIQIWFQGNPGEDNLYSENFCDVMKCK